MLRTIYIFISVILSLLFIQTSYSPYASTDLNKNKSAVTCCNIKISYSHKNQENRYYNKHKKNNTCNSNCYSSCCIFNILSLNNKYSYPLFYLQKNSKVVYFYNKNYNYLFQNYIYKPPINLAA